MSCPSCPCRVAESMALFSAGAGTWQPPLMSPEPLEPRTRLVATAQHGAERPRGWSEMSQKAVARSKHWQRHLWTRGLHDLHVPVVNPRQTYHGHIGDGYQRMDLDPDMETEMEEQET